ncbi:MAG: toll/interleukin-1 receptor domain-containing protein [Methylocella sp.]
MDIFISYANQDRSIAKLLARDLTNNSYTVWWDFELVGGADFRTNIMKQLASARCVIVIWTRYSMVSRWVRDEADEATRMNKLVPIRTNDVSEQAIPLGLRGLHALTLGNLQGLLRTLASRGIVPTHRERVCCRGTKGVRYELNRTVQLRER